MKSRLHQTIQFDSKEQGYWIRKPYQFHKKCSNRSSWSSFGHYMKYCCIHFILFILSPSYNRELVCFFTSLILPNFLIRFHRDEPTSTQRLLLLMLKKIVLGEFRSIRALTPDLQFAPCCKISLFLVSTIFRVLRDSPSLIQRQYYSYNPTVC